jgi:hypothetical protein
MPENIVKDYRHLYETKYMRKTLEDFPPKVTVEAFNGGRGEEFPNHYIELKTLRHDPDIFASTSIAKEGNGKVYAQVGVDEHSINDMQNSPSWRKMHLAYEWLQVLLTFRSKVSNDIRWTLKAKVRNILHRLKEHSKHCGLSSNDLGMHKALRVLLVSNKALQDILLRTSVRADSNITTFEDLKQSTEADRNKAYKIIILPLVEEFSCEWDVEREIVESRLQEELGMCA